jgi:hypothetical protein
VKKQPVLVALIIAALLCCIFWLAHLGWLGFSIDKKLDPAELATLAVSIFIAYFLQYYLVSRATDDRSEKDILIDSLRDVLSTLRECRDTLMACHDAGTISAARAKSIKLLFRRLANGLDNAETALAMSQCSRLAEECKIIQDALFNYKSAATGGSFPAQPYDFHAFTYQEKTYRALNQKLHDLVFKINQHR